jgi:hypothetical protein
MKKILLIAVCLTSAGCKNPFDRTRDASNGGATGTFGNTANLVIFNNELQTGGSAFEYPGGDNQSLSFADTSDPISQRSIRYSWNGQTVAAQTIFAGFDLIHVVDNTKTLSVYLTTPGRDLHQAGYTKATFYARGSLSTNTVLKIEVADDGNTTTPDPCMTLSATGSPTDDVCGANGADPYTKSPGVLTSSWQQYAIPVPNSALLNVKDFFKATFVFKTAYGAPSGNGGVVYIDKIQYEQ